MTKAELVEKIQDAHAPRLTRKKVARLVDAIFEEVERSILRSGKFTYPDFGTFFVRERKAKRGRDPRTKEEIMIPGSVTVGFRPSPAFKKSLAAYR